MCFDSIHPPPDMHHPLWPEHHGKRVWGGARGSADAEYAKLFNEAAGAPSLKEADKVGVFRFCFGVVVFLQKFTKTCQQEATSGLSFYEKLRPGKRALLLGP